MEVRTIYLLDDQVATVRVDFSDGDSHEFTLDLSKSPELKAAADALRSAASLVVEQRVRRWVP